MKFLNQNLKEKCSKKSQIHESELYFSLVTSIAVAIVSCVCFVVATYAWFSDVGTVRGNNIESGFMTVEIMNVVTDTDNKIKLEKIDKEHPVFTDADNVDLGSDIREYVAVVNRGLVQVEYNIGITTVTKTDSDIGEIIDVFYAFASSDDIKNASSEPLNFIYLGKLSDLNESTQAYLNSPTDLDAYGNESIRIKGILGAPLLEEKKQYYCLRLKLSDMAEEKYENSSLQLNVELKAVNSINGKIKNIIAVTDNESLGLVLGGGSYYRRDGGKALLKTIPASGYKLSGWVLNGSALQPTKLSENEWLVDLENAGDAYYKAIFALEGEFEEGEENLNS